MVFFTASAAIYSLPAAKTPLVGVYDQKFLTIFFAVELAFHPWMRKL